VVEAVDWTTLPGRLVVLSGASGAGKSTLVRRLIEKLDGRVEASVSATTRPPRLGEIPGVSYKFVTPEEFEAQKARILAG